MGNVANSINMGSQRGVLLESFAFILNRYNVPPIMMYYPIAVSYSSIQAACAHNATCVSKLRISSLLRDEIGFETLPLVRDTLLRPHGSVTLFLASLRQSPVPNDRIAICLLDSNPRGGVQIVKTKM